jgi:hypothetical protein
VRVGPFRHAQSRAHSRLASRPSDATRAVCEKKHDFFRFFFFFSLFFFSFVRSLCRSVCAAALADLRGVASLFWLRIAVSAHESAEKKTNGFFFHFSLDDFLVFFANLFFRFFLSEQMTALVLRIKFPPTYPLIYKTVGASSRKEKQPFSPQKKVGADPVTACSCASIPR